MSSTAGLLRSLLVGGGAILLVLLGGISDTLQAQLVAGAAHHYAHVALPLAAFVIFSGYVAVDVHRHGWPSLSWRL